MSQLIETTAAHPWAAAMVFGFAVIVLLVIENAIGNVARVWLRR